MQEYEEKNNSNKINMEILKVRRIRLRLRKSDSNINNCMCFIWNSSNKRTDDKSKKW